MSRWSLRALGLIVAGFASALLAHACLAGSSAIGLAGDYASREHSMLFPVTLAAVLGSAVAASALLLHLLDCRRSGALLDIAHAFASLDLKKPIAASASIGIGTLWCMESLEQLIAHGHLDGVLSAFGSLPCIGLALVVFAATALLIVLRKIAVWLATIAGGIVERLFTLLRFESHNSGSLVRPRVRPVRVIQLLVARTLGLRAPPRLLA